MRYSEYVVIHDKDTNKVYDIFLGDSRAWSRMPAGNFNKAVHKLYGTTCTYRRLNEFRKSIGLPT